MRRLDFVLPDFTRVAWASDAARAVWAPRVTRLSTAHVAIERLSVARGLRPCALADVAPEALAEERQDGLRVVPLTRNAKSRHGYSSTSVPPVEGQPYVWRAVIGRPRDTRRFERAWRENDQDAIGSLLGYPACCRAFFLRTWVGDGFVDTTWPMATAATAASAARLDVTVRGPWQSNILFRWAGVRAVPHLPCRFDCEETVHFADALSSCAVDEGFGEEVHWLRDMLSWPAQWTALHGIAEIETPILKIAARTDATPIKYTVRREGERYPTEGVVGLRFPYRSGRRRLPVIVETPCGDERASSPSDNGFSSLEAMHAAHAPIVALTARALKGKTGTVVDLGCGDGALVRAICAGNDRLTPMGIDKNVSGIARARAAEPRFAAGFIPGDLLDAKAMLPRRRYAMAVVMPGRLLEVDRANAARLRRWLRSACDTILVYGYGDVLAKHGGLRTLARRAGLPYAAIAADAPAALIAWRRARQRGTKGRS